MRGLPGGLKAGLDEALRAVVDMVLTQRLRVAIIVLCSAAGVAFLVGIVAAVHGVGAQIEHDVLGKLYGFNTIQVHRLGSSVDGIEREDAVRARDRRRRLTIADAEWLDEHITMDGVLAYSYGGAGHVGLGGMRTSEGLSVQILAASASQFAVQSLDVRTGRPFTEYEARRGAGVAVLGADVARHLFGARAGLEQIVDVEGLPYRVIGVLERRGKFMGFSMDNLVVVPAQSRMNGIINQRDEVDAIAFRVGRDSLLASATTLVDGAMRLRRNLAPSDEDDFELSSSAMLLEGWRRIQRILLIVGPALTAVALLVAILVTSNVMLVVVTERVPEIGLRLALGARRVDIVRQFLAESVVLAGSGGLLGVALGAGAVAVLRMGTSVPAHVAPGLALLGLIISVVVGAAAGVYPAYRAAALSPIQALSRE